MKLISIKCIVANIDADDAKNKDLATKHSISSFPTLKFFSTDNKEGILYEGGRSEADFVEYLNEKCGTQRKVGGGLTEKVSCLSSRVPDVKCCGLNILLTTYHLKAGRISSFDALAQRFYTAAKGARQTIVDEARALAASSSQEAKHYLRVMEKIVSTGEAYVEKETKRWECSRLKKYPDIDFYPGGFFPLPVSVQFWRKERWYLPRSTRSRLSTISFVRSLRNPRKRMNLKLRGLNRSCKPAGLGSEAL